MLGILLGEPELIWTLSYQEMPSKLVVRTDANWTDLDSQDQKCFSRVVVRFGDHVVGVVCAKQDVAALSAPESEFYALTTGGARGIHTLNIFGDLHVELIERLETDSTSASGICRRRGVGQLRHLYQKELWLQDQVPSEDKEADLGTKYLESDRIKKCVSKMGMLFAGAWAGEQLPVVSGTEVIIGEDLIECCQSWTIGVVLFVAVGVVLLCSACIVCYPHLPTGREREVARQLSCMSPRSMRADDIHHEKERTWILSWYSGDQLWQPMMLDTRSFYGKLHIATMSEVQAKCICNSRVCCEFVGWVTGCDDFLYESRVARELKYRFVITSCARQRETRGIELRRKLNSSTMRVTRGEYQVIVCSAELSVCGGLDRSRC